MSPENKKIMRNADLAKNKAAIAKALKRGVPVNAIKQKMLSEGMITQSDVLSIGRANEEGMAELNRYMHELSASSKRRKNSRKSRRTRRNRRN